MRRHWLLPIAILSLAGCAANPVTGKQEIQMVSQGQEIQIGEQQYGPGRQSQGGDYLTDPKVTEYVRQVGARLAAVLSHEIVHAAARHGAQQMEKGQLLQIGSAVAAVAATAYGGSGLGEMVGQGAMLGSQLLQAKYGRDDDLEADNYGMKYMKRVG